MNFMETLEQYTRRHWLNRRELLGEIGEWAEQLLGQGTAEEARYLRFVFATMPLSDFMDYDLSLFLRTVQHALQVRKDFPWCAALPEHLFLTGVLYPRINTEELSDCRGVFYEKLRDRVRNLSLTDAVLEVNRWCAEEVTYRSTDDRTASALSVYRCGYGRCGEESTFAVNALRSVGICARQVYVPRWSHCDDNHAWVEAFDGEKWRYLGACEPEPGLDRGWFTSAASRAVMIHSRTFAPGGKEAFSFLFPDTEPANLWTEQGVVYEAVTDRYAETEEVEVTVVDQSGQPIPGAEVTVSLLNMAEFSKIAALKTDENGRAKLRLGLGSVRVSAQDRDCAAEALFHVGEAHKITLILQDTEHRETDWQDFDFFAPTGAAGYPAPLTREQQKRRREWLDAAGKLRNQKMARLAEEEPTLSEQEKRIFETLTEKDKAGELPRAALLDSLSAFQWERDYPPEIFSSALLCPRIDLEPLSPWRKNISAAFSPEEQEEFRENPANIWDWIKKNVREREDYPALPASPGAILRIGAASQKEKAVLFCALCRSMGIPARISPVDGAPEYYFDGSFFSADGTTARAALILSAPPEQEISFFQNLSILRIEKDREIPVNDPEAIPAGNSGKIPLRPGKYRLVTVSRLPNGNQLAKRLDFSLRAGETRRVEAAFREGKIADFFTSLALPPFSLRDGTGQEITSAELLKRHPVSLLFWLEAGREPTEHILNELREAADLFSQRDCGLHFILERPEQDQDPTINKTLARLPQVRVWQGDFLDIVPMLARRMFVDPDKLPLILLMDRRGNGLYACAGYNVGAGNLLLKLLMESGNI